ncbi:hypothetical protein F0562_031643 [Nyssa sinensis]|uniref:Aspartate/glutamate/uridylate kinase domain-containing protein n=1 Tax=Nyssa sinensis TaxID=561372 RepID=A0A5J5AV41_9ASTE|nr:hypothetical protein F0562_031643 [Nyssa sinensis]
MDSTRTFVKDVKRVIVKVGTAVVTRADGRLALGRLGALCEQIQELNSQGYEAILVTSGAVGVGRQRLRYRRLVNSSFADLQKPQVELDGKACAAVGQNGLMALYDTLFSQLDVTSAQLLVTDNDFRDPDFRKQLTETVKTLLSLKVIPIFNENDAVSTRRAPYEDSSGIFWDNDSLAALLALELKADLLVLLSDVEGLFSGPPSDPHSKLIHTYIKERHDGGITFGDKSRVGRGGMTAKVKAAVYAAHAGIPVVITSGYATDNIIKRRESSRRLQTLSRQDRSKILLDIADALEANEKLIRVENEADVAAAQQAGYEKSLISRLALKPGKISSLTSSIRVLANMEEPIGQVLKRTEIADGFILEKTSSPLGVLLVIFESRPDALVQIASLAIRSGNGLLLKGGKEARRSNLILHKVITAAIPENVGERLIGLVTSREEIPDLLKILLPEVPALESSLACTVEIVDDVHAAIDHIHQHGSAHTDSIIAEDSEVAEVFLRQVDSAAVFHNASTRFSDGARFGLGAEVGVSTSRIHARGPVGVEGLLTTRWIARGSGQVVDGDKAVIYTHKDLTLQA